MGREMFKTDKEAQLVCIVCPKLNAGRTIQTAPGPFDLHRGPLEVCFQDYRYVLVCMFSDWVAAFSCATASTAAKILLEKIILGASPWNYTVTKDHTLQAT